MKLKPFDYIEVISVIISLATALCGFVWFIAVLNADLREIEDDLKELKQNILKINEFSNNLEDRIIILEQK